MKNYLMYAKILCVDRLETIIAFKVCLDHGITMRKSIKFIKLYEDPVQKYSGANKNQRLKC